MNSGLTVFSQIMNFLPRYEFQKCVARYRGNYKIQSFPCLQHFYVMAFAQLTYRESLRDIEDCLKAMHHKLYHSGIRSPVSRSTLSDANDSRDWRIYADFAQVLIRKARSLYASEDIGVELEQMVYALDSTTIDLCLALFPWARFRRYKAAVKMHTLIDIHGPIPFFIWITDGKVHDVNILDELIPEPGAIYLVDRGYIDFQRLHLIHVAQASFVTLAKSNMQFRRLYSHASDAASGILSDQTIILTGVHSSTDYPDKLRRVHYFDKEHQNHLFFLTNDFIHSSLTIAQLYKCRWRVEIFFKWIKQNLRIKAFYGYSENAVKSQIWIAICVYVLIAIIKKKLNIEKSLYTFLQIINVSIFDKSLLQDLFSDADNQNSLCDSSIQLNLFEL
jgi:hypothetical protein